MRFLTIFLVISTSFAHTLYYQGPAPLKIIKIGHPTLRLIAEEVPYESISDKKTQTLIDDMILTMKKAGGVGLAAPQVNESLRLFVIKPSIFKKAEAIINPQIDYIEDRGTKDSNEGCLSIPGQKFTVSRYNEIQIKYFNRNGEEKFEHAKGFRAVVMQHEYDHLNGILISDFFTKELTNFTAEDWESIPLM